MAELINFPYEYRGVAGVDISDIHDAQPGYYQMQGWTECKNKVTGSGLVLCFKFSISRKMVIQVLTTGEMFLSVCWDNVWERDNLRIN